MKCYALITACYTYSTPKCYYAPRRMNLRMNSLDLYSRQYAAINR